MRLRAGFGPSITRYPTQTHIAAAVLGDTITTLSNAWNDIASFNTGSGGGAHLDMNASDMGYRFASVLGKSISFLQPTTWSTEDDFGNDGGANNIVRLQENWGGHTMYYRGDVNTLTFRQLLRPNQ